MTRITRNLLVTLCFGVGSARAVAAQGTCPAIRPNEATVVRTVGDIFTNPDYQPVRTRLQITTLSGTVTKTYVTDASVCSTLYSMVFNNVGAMWNLPDSASKAALLSSLDIRYYRVGDYYVAQLDSPPGGGMHLSGRIPLMIFRRPVLQYLGVVLQ